MISEEVQKVILSDTKDYKKTDRALILFPRLDCSFKKGSIPAAKGLPNHPLRYHWIDFKHTLKERLAANGISVAIQEKALWQFNPEDVAKTCKDLDCDQVYIPHKQNFQFQVAGVKNFYYMQTVFPHIFTLDTWGWGHNMTYSPIQPWKHECIDIENGRKVMAELQKRISNNVSKFAQPSQGKLNDSDYMTFICQLPHDETIKYFSDVEVIDALRCTCNYAIKHNKKLYVKGHPANPSSQGPLKSVAQGFNHSLIRWVEDVSIHDLFRNTDLVVCVNSGTGMEAMLHHKPVLTFGRSEYQDVVNNATIKTFEDDVANATCNIDMYVEFFDLFDHYSIVTSKKKENGE